jgi:hypothetical protein
LELTFHTAELRDICDKRAKATAQFGYAAGRELADRLADIEALDTVADLSLLLGEAICDRTPNEKVLHLDAGYDVIFVSAHPQRSKGAPKPTNWTTTSRVKIIAIEAANG